MAVDGVIDCVARASPTMILAITYERIFIAHEEIFQLPAPSHCRKRNDENAHLFILLKKNQCGES